MKILSALENAGVKIINILTSKTVWTLLLLTQQYIDFFYHHQLPLCWRIKQAT